MKIIQEEYETEEEYEENYSEFDEEEEEDENEDEEETEQSLYEQINDKTKQVLKYNKGDINVTVIKPAIIKQSNKINKRNKRQNKIKNKNSESVISNDQDKDDNMIGSIPPTIHKQLIEVQKRIPVPQYQSSQWVKQINSINQREIQQALHAKDQLLNQKYQIQSIDEDLSKMDISPNAQNSLLLYSDDQTNNQSTKVKQGVFEQHKQRTQQNQAEERKLKIDMIERDIRDKDLQFKIQQEMKKYEKQQELKQSRLQYTDKLFQIMYQKELEKSQTKEQQRLEKQQIKKQRELDLIQKSQADYQLLLQEKKRKINFNATQSQINQYYKQNNKVLIRTSLSHLNQDRIDNIFLYQIRRHLYQFDLTEQNIDLQIQQFVKFFNRQNSKQLDKKELQKLQQELTLKVIKYNDLVFKKEQIQNQQLLTQDMTVEQRELVLSMQNNTKKSSLQQQLLTASQQQYIDIENSKSYSQQDNQVQPQFDPGDIIFDDNNQQQNVQDSQENVIIQLDNEDNNISKQQTNVKIEEQEFMKTLQDEQQQELETQNTDIIKLDDSQDDQDDQLLNQQEQQSLTQEDEIQQQEDKQIENIEENVEQEQSSQQNDIKQDENDNIVLESQSDDIQNDQSYSNEYDEEQEEQ